MKKKKNLLTRKENLPARLNFWWQRASGWRLMWRLTSTNNTSLSLSEEPGHQQPWYLPSSHRFVCTNRVFYKHIHFFFFFFFKSQRITKFRCFCVIKYHYWVNHREIGKNSTVKLTKNCESEYFAEDSWTSLFRWKFQAKPTLNWLNIRDNQLRVIQRLAKDSVGMSKSVTVSRTWICEVHSERLIECHKFNDFEAYRFTNLWTKYSAKYYGSQIFRQLRTNILVNDLLNYSLAKTSRQCPLTACVNSLKIMICSKFQNISKDLRNLCMKRRHQQNGYSCYQRKQLSIAKITMQVIYHTYI